MPVERGLAADVQPFHATLEEAQARMQFERSIRSSEDPASETREPTCAYVVHGEIGGHPKGRELR